MRGLITERKRWKTEQKEDKEAHSLSVEHCHETCPLIVSDSAW